MSAVTLRTYHPFMRRRPYREKKLTAEYMRILELRGRKILELDNESEA